LLNHDRSKQLLIIQFDMSNTFSHILSLKRGTTKYGPAPHKPILLLAVLESFEHGEITTPAVEITDDLFVRFHDIWTAYVHTGHVANFSLPFFHLKNEKGQFWRLITYPGREIPTTKSKSIKSFKALSETVYCARLSDELFKVFMDPIKREALKQAMLKAYFGKEAKLNQKNSYSTEVKSEMLYEPEQNYVRKVKRHIEARHTEEREEYVIIRSSIFRKAISEIYAGRCAICGLQVKDQKNRPLVDACHIIPFAESYNDSVRNGIALSPTFHRAFDKGLISLSDDYRVILHPQLKDESADFSFMQYRGKSIHLPTSPRFHPSPKSLAYHRQ